MITPPAGGKRHHSYPKILVYDDGRVWSTTSKRFLESTVVKQYPYVYVYTENHKRVGRLLHRLVAELFVRNPKPDKYHEVNHKDGNKLNCRASNLEWVNRTKNMVHSWKMKKKRENK